MIDPIRHKLLRAFAASLAHRLQTDHPNVFVEPGRALFPKRVHELPAGSPRVPDGQSDAYLRLAAERSLAARSDVLDNLAAAPAGDSYLAPIAAAMQLEVERAVLLERRLLAHLGSPS